MPKKILLSRLFYNTEFDSEPRRDGLARLAKYGTLSQHPDELTEEHAEDVIAVLAGGPQVHEELLQGGRRSSDYRPMGGGFRNRERGSRDTIRRNHYPCAGTP